MPQLLVVGGRQRRGAISRQEWQAYDQARVVLVDPESGDVELFLTYETPRQFCAPGDASQVLNAGYLDGNRLWLVTLTDVSVWDCQARSMVEHWSHPWFNDLHHVRPWGNDHWVVANTGLDQVLKLDMSGNVVEQWGVGEQATWDRFEERTDYRQVATTKPHETHPNYLIGVGDDLWVTRFHPQDAICLTRQCAPILLKQGGPHDGVEVEDAIGFTTVNGYVGLCPQAEFLLKDGTRGAIRWTALLPPGSSQESLGWCRGLYGISSQEAWVGFSRLRPTRFRSHVSWLKHGFKTVGLHGTRPTRIAHYDLVSGACLKEIDLESVGLSAIFGIYPWNAAG